MVTSKSPKRVLQYAWLVGDLALKPYSHRFSPHKFTQAQLFACLVLKEFLQLDYRKVEQLLKDCPELAEAIHLESVPCWSTLHKASQRLLHAHAFDQLLGKTLQIAQVEKKLPQRLPLAALDGTGFESHHASCYYVERCEKSKKTKWKPHCRPFPKAGILCDARSHLILAVAPGKGPGPDIKHFRQTLDQACRHIMIETLAADAGYDSEPTHEYARGQCGVRTLIPPLIGRPTDKLPSGYWRRQMKLHLHQSRYGQRWQVETVNSMIKRLLGSALRARRHWNQMREIYLRTLTLNVMILRKRRGFPQSRTGVFFTFGVFEGDHARVAYSLTPSVALPLASTSHRRRGGRARRILVARSTPFRSAAR